ncbi:conjugal transfer protein TrbL [Cryobacterium roopkundense]|uniref:Conjugal transfer protein TrbL n=1 Tax=Cryobacterium roopkundense TaxID=1001240 RepID=A0A099J2R7_9MICO|nr:DUF2269 family protein [Cryobacterium roopkundense]KGJ71743.1 conjugal transfer protein TrbL [Cryobacterium roopkundense]MBB5641405.1 putative membrane protein [Cryobacterium roopkundense]
MDTLINTLHIVAAVFIVGPMAILPMTAMRLVRAGQSGPVAVLAKSVSIFSLLSLLVAVLGFGALSMGGYVFAATWVWLSIVLYAIALAINLFLVVPALQSAAEELTAREGAGVATKVAAYSRIAMGSGIAALLLVAVVVLMVWRP